LYLVKVACELPDTQGDHCRNGTARVSASSCECWVGQEAFLPLRCAVF